MVYLILKNNYFYFFNFFILNNFNYFILNNNFFLIYYYYKIYTFIKYFYVLKKFYIYSFNFLNFFILNYLNKIFIKIFLKLNFLLLGFVHYKFFLKIGLGFRKKYCLKFKTFVMYAGGRHWLIFSPVNDFYFNIRRKNILIFTSTLSSLNYYTLITKYMRKETVFKTKGFMFKRVIIKRKIPRSIMFARRIKFSKIKLKLSKKQKLV